MRWTNGSNSLSKKIAANLRRLPVLPAALPCQKLQRRLQGSLPLDWEIQWSGSQHLQPETPDKA